MMFQFMMDLGQNGRHNQIPITQKLLLLLVKLTSSEKINTVWASWTIQFRLSARWHYVVTSFALNKGEYYMDEKCAICFMLSCRKKRWKGTCKAGHKVHPCQFPWVVTPLSVSNLWLRCTYY